MAREEPEWVASVESVPTAGRLRDVDPDHDLYDGEADLVADDSEADDGGLTAEEAAMHIVDDVPGGTTDAGPGYVDDEAPGRFA